MYDILTIFAGFIFLFSVVSGGLARTPISGPILFCAFGWLIGPLMLGWFDINVEAEGLRLLAELTLALVLVAEEIGIGAAVGIGVSFLGVQLLKFCRDRGWVTETWRQLPVISLAIGSFAAAQLIGGSGFIAAFVGGLLFGALAKERKHVARQRRHFIFLGQEIGFGYWDSPLVTPDGSPHYVEQHAVEDPIYTYIANARPGARAPHCWVAHAAEPDQKISLLDLFTVDFTLLLHGDVEGWPATLGDLPTNISLNVFSIGRPDSGADLIDCDATWNRCYGIDNAGAVLVRPDGHVAWRAACRAEDHGGDSVTDALRQSLALDAQPTGG